ncbi:hypothetical protein GCM10007857_61690 [Bradyrhizobium iriomotense]|uniref:Uncharacterized protein n=1 Tax=Bradyrhizobium iriomotense TaxID=441950 RepID=A0ABQ6B6K8_9BRAD|nr:hypothetical protein GCM10007857_61690 [Bradyrhizobium iriomotense]
MDVAYCVAFPFVLADHGVAAGDAMECLSANAAVMRAEESLAQARLRRRDRIQPNRGSGDRQVRRCQASPTVFG